MYVYQNFSATLCIHATLGEVVVRMHSLMTLLEGSNVIMTSIKVRFPSDLLGKSFCDLRLLWIWSELVVLSNLLSSSTPGLGSDHWSTTLERPLEASGIQVMTMFGLTSRVRHGAVFVRQQ